MAVKGVANIKKNVGQWRVKVEKEATGKVLTAIAMTGSAYSKLMAPVDTAALINSGFYTVNGNTATIGYKAGFSEKGFNYGLFLHESTKWTPRKKKDATDHFLSKAFELQEYQDDYKAIIFNGYKL